MCYTTCIHTPFYASGFLYNLKTHQILLLSSGSKDDISSAWSIIGGESKEGEEAQHTFQRIIQKKLNINLKKKHIYPIYDYFHSTLNKINYVFYAEVKKTKIRSDLRGSTLSWFTFSETLKLPFTTRTKQDIVVGERVINAKWRNDEAAREEKNPVF